MPSLNLDPTALFEEALIDLAQYTAVGSLCSSVPSICLKELEKKKKK